MKKKTAFLLFAPVILAACAESVATGNLPEEVVSIAAPNQDLASARVLPEDGCYWYSHKGPVETTLLPLRTKAGRPICTKPQA